MKIFINNYRQISTTILTLILAIIIVSCSTDDNINAQKAVERVDIKFEGDLEKYIEKEANPDSELVKFDRTPSAKSMQFTINLSDTKQLIFKVTNEERSKIWLTTNKGYSLYPTQNIDDKRSYVIAEYVSAGETRYISNQEELFPNQPHLNVFTIVEYNPLNNEILCKLKDFPMTKTASAGEDMIKITGTFRGKIEFLEM